MRYTVDPLYFPDEDLPEASPVLVEVLGPDGSVRPLRDRDGHVVGGASGTSAGRSHLKLLGDNELLERLKPLCDAIRDLDEHITALHTVHRADGSDPESADEEAEIRTKLRFATLIAHAVAAVELVTDGP